jgi:hypothetical protein
MAKVQMMTARSEVWTVLRRLSPGLHLRNL